VIIARTGFVIVALLSLGGALLSRPVHATPSTTFWAPSTPAMQPFGVLHVTYDSYFNAKAEYPIDAGLTIGILPGDRFQAEAGFDLFYPTFAAGEAVGAPVVLNGKIGAPEDVYFKGQPAWSVGFFGVGLKKGVNDQNALYAMFGKTFPRVGIAQIGAYHGLNAKLFRSSAGDEVPSGLLAGWYSPSFNVPHLDKLLLCWDVQTGKNVLGASGGGAYLYFTPAIDLLTGPVFFFDKRLQPGGSSWMWSVQLDVDLNMLSGRHE
jgi:hypothetical protein